MNAFVHLLFLTHTHTHTFIMSVYVYIPHILYILLYELLIFSVHRGRYITTINWTRELKKSFRICHHWICEINPLRLLQKSCDIKNHIIVKIYLHFSPILGSWGDLNLSIQIHDFFFKHLLSQHLFGTVCFYLTHSFFAYCVEMFQFETQNEHVFLNAPPWVWISSHLVDKCSVIRSTICRDGPCDGDSDKCCCGDHLLSEGYRNTEESQSVLGNLLRISFSNFYIDWSFIKFRINSQTQNCKVEDHELSKCNNTDHDFCRSFVWRSWTVAEYDCFI